MSSFNASETRTVTYLCWSLYVCVCAVMYVCVLSPVWTLAGWVNTVWAERGMWDGLSPDICCTDKQTHAHTAVESCIATKSQTQTHSNRKKKAVDIREWQKTPQKQKTDRDTSGKTDGKKFKLVVYITLKPVSPPGRQSCCHFFLRLSYIQPSNTWYPRQGRGPRSEQELSPAEWFLATTGHFLHVSVWLS